MRFMRALRVRLAAAVSAALLAKMLRWSPGVLPLPGGGRQRLQPVWVGDVAECFLQATRMERSPEEVYDVCGPEVLELRDVVSVLAIAVGRRPPAIVPLPMRPLGALAGLAEKILPALPVTEDQLKMLEIGSETSPEAI